MGGKGQSSLQVVHTQGMLRFKSYQEDYIFCPDKSLIVCVHLLLRTMNNNTT